MGGARGLTSPFVPLSHEMPKGTGTNRDIWGQISVLNMKFLSNLYVVYRVFYIECSVYCIIVYNKNVVSC